MAAYGPTSADGKYYTTGEYAGRLVSSVPQSAPANPYQESGGSASQVIGTPDKSYTQDASPATVITSDTITNKVIPDLKDKFQKLTNPATPTPQQIQDNGIQEARVNGGTYTGIDNNQYYNYDGSPVQNATSQTDLGLDPVSQKLIDEMKSSNDAALKGALDNISSMFATRRAQMQDINTRQQEGEKQSLLMGGSSRYAQQSSDSIISAQERAGVMELSQLDSEEAAAVNAARTAYTSNNFQILDKQLSIIEKKREEKAAAAQKLSEQIAQQNQKLHEKVISASRDSAIADLVNQGITDPSKILGLLNYDEKGNLIGDISSDEVAKVFKNLSISGNASDVPKDLETFNYLQKNKMLPKGITDLPAEQQYFAFLNMNKLAASGKLSTASQNYGGGVAPSSGGGTYVGKGATNATDEQIIRMRLFAKLSTILNKGSLSDSDRTTINANISTLRQAGLSEQQIMSRLAGFPTDVNTAYNQQFIDTITSNTDTNDQQQTSMAKVGQLLASGNSEGAMRTVENLAMTNAKKLDPDNYMGSATATTFLQNIAKVQQDLKDGGITGIVSGSLQNVLGRMKGPKTATLKADVTKLVAQFRKDIAGSNVTESESTFLNDLIPDISDNNFMQKLDAFQNGVLTRYNSTRSSVNLPEVSVDQAINSSKRLKLYESSTHDDFWGGSAPTSNYSITNDDGSYDIPE